MRVFRRAVLFLFLSVGASPAFAQSAVAPIAAATPQQTNAIYSTLYSRPSSPTLPTPSDQTVRPTPDQIGYPSAYAIWYPAITGAAFYDDNVFARHTNRQGDWAGVVRPELSWRSVNMPNVDVVGTAYVERRVYNTFSTEDQTNGGAAMGATIRPGPDTQVVGRISYVRAHEDRGTSDLQGLNFLRPLQYDQGEAAGAINQRFGSFWTSLGGATAVVRFQNGIINGFVVPQDYRDGTIVTAPARFGYVVAPLTSVFVEVAANERSFHVDEFSSRGWRVVGGMMFEPGQGARIKGEFYGGYMAQAYNNGFGFQDISTWTYGMSLAYLVMPNLTATLEGRRDAREASLSGGILVGIPGDGVSVIETIAAGRLDWAALPNLVIGGGIAFLEDEYVGASRTDRAWSPLFSIKYFPTPRLTLGFDYRYLNFDSSGLGILGYYKNVYLLSANLKL